MNTRTRSLTIAATLTLSCILTGAAPQPDQVPPKQPPIVNFRLRGEIVELVKVAYNLAPEFAAAWDGHMFYRAYDVTACKDSASGVDSTRYPSNVAFDFRAPPPPIYQGRDWCVFTAVVGAETLAKGEMVPALDVPHQADNSPVLQIGSGYAVLGGNYPTAKGRRGRAGAPGTQFAVELTDDPDGPEFYYLLNQFGHKLEVYVGEGTSKLTAELVDDQHYIKVSSDGGISVNAIAGDLDREKFLAHAKAIADCAKLEGADPKLLAALVSLKLPQDKGSSPAPDAPVSPSK